MECEAATRRLAAGFEVVCVTDEMCCRTCSAHAGRRAAASSNSTLPTAGQDHQSRRRVISNVGAPALSDSFEFIGAI